jgi:phage terminase small subunit
MAALQNARHERFAQELASGKTLEQAHRMAGYKASRSGASQLKQNINISARINEILIERESLHGQATADAIKATALTKEWVIEMLTQNVAKAMQATPVTDDEGNPIGEFQYQGSVANRALELLGKELGMFVERTQNENVNTNYVVSGDPVDSVQDWEAEHTAKH